MRHRPTRSAQVGPISFSVRALARTRLVLACTHVALARPHGALARPHGDLARPGCPRWSGAIAGGLVVFLLVAMTQGDVSGQLPENRKHGDPQDRFYPIDAWLPTPSPERTASGAPGPAYWQQRADYEIDVTLDDATQRIRGVSKIRYHNRSPHELRYLWVQLDQNLFEPDSVGASTARAPSLSPRMTFRRLESTLARLKFDGGYTIDSVTGGLVTGEGADGSREESLDHVVVDTMMRVDLPGPLEPGGSVEVAIAYSYNIVNAELIRARGGYEHFEEDDNSIYEIAQFYPRVAAYTDYTGWQNKGFLGIGEFTLELGDYRVRITVPEDMVVGATGELQNPEEVLKPEWRERLAAVPGSEKPTFIVTPEEAKSNESSRSAKTKTWVFEAENVRDFAFAASRKFIWDAMATEVEGERVLAMSLYPNEAEPLWSQYSTESIVHALDVYGRYAFPYPYPVAISVNGPVYGMEYPMICFNGPRPEADGTYSEATKYGLISVVIHEVGHNFFPMIVNSDERQWMWMDEGINSFLQYLAEQEWEEDYPSRRGEPEKITGYMKGGNQRAVMTPSDQLLQIGPNAYSKPATALNILRETILGRELFDFAFREYARRWRFKRPTPADFFRTMEDASGVDLDWFWRGWFYSTDHVDIGIEGVELFQIDRGDPDQTAERKRQERDRKEKSISDERNESLRRRIEWQPGLKDFYNSPQYDEFAVEETDRKAFRKFMEGLDATERSLLERKSNFYVVTFENVGGLVMPIIVRLHFTDGGSELVTIPAEIWRADSRKVRKLFVTEKEILRLELDPKRQTADVDAGNDHWPPKIVPSRFKLFKESESKNEMQKAGLGKPNGANGREENAESGSAAEGGSGSSSNDSSSNGSSGEGESGGEGGEE